MIDSLPAQGSKRSRRFSVTLRKDTRKVECDVPPIASSSVLSPVPSRNGSLSEASICQHCGGERTDRRHSGQNSFPLQSIAQALEGLEPVVEGNVTQPEVTQPKTLHVSTKVDIDPDYVPTCLCFTTPRLSWLIGRPKLKISLKGRGVDRSAPVATSKKTYKSSRQSASSLDSIAPLFAQRGQSASVTLHPVSEECEEPEEMMSPYSPISSTDDSPRHSGEECTSPVEFRTCTCDSPAQAATEVMTSGQVVRLYRLASVTSSLKRCLLDIHRSS